MAKKPLFKILPDSIIKAGGRGYQYCQTEPPHPNGMVLGDRKARYVYLHIARMELSLGRLLHKGEEVHHKDGDVSNNALSNLELKDGKKHQMEHAKEKEFWKKSPRTHKRKASAYRVASQFLADNL